MAPPAALSDRARAIIRRTIIHADLDAFYASVEVLDDPSLRGKPVIVGGGPDERGRGERRLVRGARLRRPIGHAAAHGRPPLPARASSCPAVPSATVSCREQVMAIFADYTPLVEPISLDEAFLDVSASARRVRRRRDDRRGASRTGCSTRSGWSCRSAWRPTSCAPRSPPTCASRTRWSSCRPASEAAFLAPLPIRRLWGVGPQAQAGAGRLRRDDDRPAGRHASRRTLHRRFGRHGDDLAARARGIDRRRSESMQAPKSVGHEHTFDTDTADRGPPRGDAARPRRVGRQPAASPRPRRRIRPAQAALRGLRDAHSPGAAAAPDARDRTRSTRPALALLRRTLVDGPRRPAHRPDRHQPDRCAAADAVRRPAARPTGWRARSTPSASDSATAPSRGHGC